MKKLTVSLLIACLSIITLTQCGGEEPRSQSEVNPQVIMSGFCNAFDRSNHVFRTNRPFANKWEECSRSAWGNGADTAKCLVKSFPGLSQPCATCFGNYAECSRSNCKMACMFGSKADCVKCATSNCEPSLVSCSGVPSNMLPSQN